MICNRCWVLHLQRLLGPGSDFCSLLNLFVLSHLGGGESKKLISSYSCVLQTKEGLGTVDYGFCCLEACNLQGTSTIPVGFILFLVTISILNHGILIWSIPSAQNPSSPPHPPSPSRFCKAFLRPENKNYKKPLTPLHSTLDLLHPSVILAGRLDRASCELESSPLISH